MRPAFGSVLIAVTLAAAGARAVTQEIALPPLLGSYQADGQAAGTQRSVTVVLDHPRADASAVFLRLQGTITAGHGYCDQRDVQLMSELNVTIPDAGGTLESHFLPTQGGAFEVTLPFPSVPAASLQQGWLAIFVECGAAPGCATLYVDVPDAISITAAGLVIDTPAAVATSTWGQLKSLYGR